MNLSRPTPPPGLPVCQGKNHRCSTSSQPSPPTIDLALDAIGASEIERRVAHLVCKVNSPRSALRVVRWFRDATNLQNHPTATTGENSQQALQPQANSVTGQENEK